MKKITTRTAHRIGRLQDRQLTIGLDVGDRSSFYCVIDGKGEVILEAKVATRPEADRHRRLYPPKTGSTMFAYFRDSTLVKKF